MSSPSAHSVLWAIWASGHPASVHSIFTDWGSIQVDADDTAGAADLLLMDCEWLRAPHEASLLEVLEASNPSACIQGVVSKWARGYVCQELVAVHTWDSEKVERNRPELAKYLAHSPDLGRRVQPGSGNHWRKLGALVEHVDALADVVGAPGMPLSMIRIIERFAEGARQWLKVA